jgi:hypothetical protein
MAWWNPLRFLDRPQIVEEARLESSIRPEEWFSKAWNFLDTVSPAAFYCTGRYVNAGAALARLEKLLATQDIDQKLPRDGRFGLQFALADDEWLTVLGDPGKHTYGLSVSYMTERRKDERSPLVRGIIDLTMLACYGRQGVGWPGKRKQGADGVEHITMEFEPCPSTFTRYRGKS